METTQVKQVSVPMALIAMAVLALILIGGFAIFSITTISVFLLAIVAMAIIGLISGFKLHEIETFFLDGTRKAVSVAMILLTVGTVIGA